jgi:hypothetical protein
MQTKPNKFMIMMKSRKTNRNMKSMRKLRIKVNRKKNKRTFARITPTTQTGIQVSIDNKFLFN